MSGMDVLLAIRNLDIAIAESDTQISGNLLEAVAELKQGLVGKMQFAVVSSDGQWLWVGDGFDEAVTAFNKAATQRDVALVQIIAASGDAGFIKCLV